MPIDSNADDAATRRLGALSLPATGELDAGSLPSGARGWVPEQPGFAVASSVPGAPPTRAGPLSDWSAHLPAWLEPASARALVSLAAVTVLCLAVTAWVLLHPGAASSLPARAAPPPSFASPAPGPPGGATSTVVVDVGGRVRHPGLVTLPLGARVADALRAAGGALRAADVATLDLAARVADGQLLLVGVSAPGGGLVGPTGGGGSVAPLALNSATVDQLDALPGVGPVLARHIVEWRDAHGGFTSVDQLRHVAGVGPRTFARLAPLVTL